MLFSSPLKGVSRLPFLAKEGVALVTWPTFQISRPPNISARAEDTNFKFCIRIDRRGY